MRGFIKAILGLAFLEAVLSSTAAAKRAGGVFDLATKALSWIVSPFVPAIPDLSKGK